MSDVTVKICIGRKNYNDEIIGQTHEKLTSIC